MTTQKGYNMAFIIALCLFIGSSAFAQTSVEILELESALESNPSKEFRLSSPQKDLEAELNEYAPSVQKSQFFYAPGADANAIQLEFKNIDRTYTRVDENMKNYGFSFQHAFTHRLSAKLGLSYESATLNSQMDNEYGETMKNNSRSSGLNDVALGGMYAIPFSEIEGAQLMGGADLYLSPVGSGSTDTYSNRFSGKQTLIPYLGVESALRKILLGAKISTRFMGENSVSVVGLTSEMFCEFPIVDQVKMTLVGTVGREPSDVERVANNFGLGLRANYSVMSDLSALAYLEGSTLLNTTQITTTSFGLGLRKTL